MLTPQIATQTRKTVLSGIQPTSTLHIGNYIGALSLWASHLDDFHNLFCVADLHALTIPEHVQPDTLRRQAKEVAALYIACGIDPQKATIFRQSDVSSHTYLAWILGCCTPVGWLERMTQYKVKSVQAESVGSGLLNYPVLQAADILIYKPDYVPVGDDQVQHVELMRDIARRFNHLFGEYFPIPEVMTRSSGARIMALDDPTAKMSKSVAAVNPRHAVCLLDDPDAIRHKLMSAVTDSGSEIGFENGSPGVVNLLVLYEVLSGETRAEIVSRFAGKGYGYLKREVADLVIQTVQPIQNEFHRLVADTRYLDSVLEAGAASARAIADRTLADVRHLTGLNN